MTDRLTVAEAAEILQVTAMTVRRLIVGGRLPAERHGRAYVVRRADLKRIEWGKPGRPKKGEA